MACWDAHVLSKATGLTGLLEERSIPSLPRLSHTVTPEPARLSIYWGHGTVTAAIGVKWHLLAACRLTNIMRNRHLPQPPFLPRRSLRAMIADSVFSGAPSMHVQLLSWRLQLLNAQNHVCEWGAKEVLHTNLKR